MFRVVLSSKFDRDGLSRRSSPSTNSFLANIAQLLFCALPLPLFLLIQSSRVASSIWWQRRSGLVRANSDRKSQPPSSRRRSTRSTTDAASVRKSVSPRCCTTCRCCWHETLEVVCSTSRLSTDKHYNNLHWPHQALCRSLRILWLWAGNGECRSHLLWSRCERQQKVVASDPSA